MSETQTPMKENKIKLEFIPSNFQLHSFSVQIENDTIFFQVIKMKDSLYIWIGDRNKPLLINMALAMNTKYDKTPLTTTVMGDHMEIHSRNIACRLARKLQKVVYVSFNVAETLFNVSVIEKRLNDEIKKYPEKF